MIINTIEELRLYLPSHMMDDIEPLKGYFESSELAFLQPKIGNALYASLQEKYTGMMTSEKINMNEASPWEKLVRLCQKPIVFDSLYRAADMSSISVNNTGLNVATSGGYDSAPDKSIDRYKKRAYKESHEAIDQLLIFLETLAHSVINGSEDEEEKEIVELWRKSDYYFQDKTLLINTAVEFNKYVNIYENRDKFISLRADVLYCQEVMLEEELGEPLMTKMLQWNNGEIAITEEQKAVVSKFLVRLKRWLAAEVEKRATWMFKRADAVNDALMNRSLARKFMQTHQEAFIPEVEHSPNYVPPPPPPDPKQQTCPPPECAKGFNNCDKGNAIFVI